MKCHAWVAQARNTYTNNKNNNKNNNNPSISWRNSRLLLSSSSSSSSNTATTTTSAVNGQPEPPEGQVDENDHVTTSQVLSLDSIRESLIRQEETIIFALIERAQFRQNLVVYQTNGLGKLGTPPGSIPVKDGDLSFMEYLLVGTEALHGMVRRYTSPEEHAFFPNRVPNPVLQELDYPSLLAPGSKQLNWNPILLQKYITDIVPAICVAGDDEQYGSSVLCDVAVLQALSRRIHYGKFVAESKYMANPQEYQNLIDRNDHVSVMKLLTNAAVEEKVLQRARLKAATYGTEPFVLSTNSPILKDLPKTNSINPEDTSLIASAAASAVVAAMEAMSNDDNPTTMSIGNKKVCPETVERIYRDIVIPLTKDIEVAYLFQRCGKQPPPMYGPDRLSTDYVGLGDRISTSNDG